MFKLIYLPTAEAVELYNDEPYSKDRLERYMGEAYYFFKREGKITITTIGGGRLRDRKAEGLFVPKHLLEIIEVPNV
jgi:hypothetical protein